MFESKDANPIKLACQQTCARAHRRCRNHGHNNTVSGHPAIAVLLEHQLLCSSEHKSCYVVSEFMWCSRRECHGIRQDRLPSTT